MSESGQQHALVGSAKHFRFTHSADVSWPDHHFRVVPKGDLSRCSKFAQLFDHVVGEYVKLGRNRNAERVGSFAIDH
jgi:hypothetical protein